MPHQSSLEQLKGPVLVSACLLGIPCRYDGSSRTIQRILSIPDIIPISICPERLGGLPTPRPRACFTGGDGCSVIAGRAFVLDIDGKDVTGSFVRGAEHSCRIASAADIRHAILKEGSPSCGTHRVWIEREQKEGLGVAAAMLRHQGVCLWNEDGLTL